MIRKLSALLAASLVLAGCATSGYGYRGDGGGDYYYGRSNGGYYDGYGAGYDGYGYDRYGYGGYGYGPYAPTFYGGYGAYYGGGYRPYYPYYPHNPQQHPHRPDPQRQVTVPNRRLPGFDYPPGATRFPNRPTGPRGPVTVHSSPGTAPVDGSRMRRTEVPARGRMEGPGSRAVAVPTPSSAVRAPRAVSPEPRPAPESRMRPSPEPRMQSAPQRRSSGSRARSQER